MVNIRPVFVTNFQSKQVFCKPLNGKTFVIGLQKFWNKSKSYVSPTKTNSQILLSFDYKDFWKKKKVSLTLKTVSSTFKLGQVNI